MADPEVTSGLGELRDRVGRLETDFSQMRNDLAENTVATKSIASDTADLVEFTRAVQWLAKIAKPMSYVAAIGASAATAWAAFKSGLIGPK